MSEDVRTVERKIAALREEMRGTLDRSKLPGLRERLMEEVAKLHAFGLPNDAAVPRHRKV